MFDFSQNGINLIFDIKEDGSVVLQEFSKNASENIVKKEGKSKRHSSSSDGKIFDYLLSSFVRILKFYYNIFLNIFQENILLRNRFLSLTLC